MESIGAPLTIGAATWDQSTLTIAAIIFAVVVAFALGARKEMAMFAVFAGIIGVILTV
ncbi:MAG: hypothetical protein AAF674_04250 [Pseudomonadota bacterium]